MTHIYIVKVFEEGRPIDYEYSNLKHATEHFDEEQGPCYLIDYVWNSETHKRKNTVLRSK